MNEFYEFADCSCRFPIIGPKVLQKSDLPALEVDWNNIPLDCKKTYELLSTGKTRLCFQLEKGGGRNGAKQLKPENIEHIAALGALLRPGCASNRDKDGISTTEHFYRRKNGIEEVKPYHPAVDAILGKTFNLLLYQEQSMKLAEAVAGFNKQEADDLRKCITSDSMFVSKTRGYISLYDMLHLGYKKDMFLTMTEDGQQYWDKITDVWFTKKVSTLKIKTKTGLTLRCTRDHKILTNNGWKEAEKLSDNDWIITSRLSNFDGCDVIKNELAIIIAGIICEGFVGENSYTFVNHNVEMMDIFLTSCRKVIPEQYIQINNPKVTVLNIGTKLVLSKYIKDKVLSDTKALPPEMMSSSIEQTRLFLSFMLACEGGISQSGQFEFSSKSPILITQVRDLLRRFGIISFLKKKIIKNNNVYYRLYINDISSQKILQKELNVLWPTDKKETLEKILNKKSQYCFSSDSIPKNICEKFINDGGKPVEGKTNFLKRMVSFSKLKRIAHNEYWKNFAKGNQYYDRVVSVEECAPERTYDFTMMNSQRPYAVVNNMVISNSIGKKLPEEMAKVKKWFIDGAKRVKVVSEEQAVEIFGWIQESQRYSFNFSHAVEYGIVGYWSAYAKSHFLVPAFTGWLAEAPNKQKPFEEVADLVSDAKTFNIEVYPPNILDLEENFHTDGETITFGISNIRGIGEAQTKNIIDIIKEEVDGFKPLHEWTWYEFIIKVCSRASKTVIEGLIKTGGLRYLGELRSKLLTEYQTFRELTDGEIEWIKESYTKWTNIADAIEDLAKFKEEKGLATKTKAEEEKLKPKRKRKKKIDQEDFWPESREECAQILTDLGAIVSIDGEIVKGKEKNPGKADINRSITLFDKARVLRNPITPYRDNPAEIASNEENLLGVSLTCSIADGKPGERWTMTCKDISNNPETKSLIVLKVRIDEVKTHIIKKGKAENIGREMAFIRVSDGTCSLEDISCFSDQWEGTKDEDGEVVKHGFKNVLQVGRVLEIQLEKGFKSKDNRLHIKEVWEI